MINLLDLSYTRYYGSKHRPPKSGHPLFISKFIPWRARDVITGFFEVRRYETAAPTSVASFGPPTQYRGQYHHNRASFIVSYLQ